MAKTRAEFINLERAGAPLETAVARLAAYHFGAGARVLIQAADAAQAARLDEALWTFDHTSFVPHGLHGVPDSEAEPVLITTGGGNPNQADVLIMAYPREPAQPADYRLIIDFVPADGGPELQAARERYRSLQGNDQVELAYITDLP